MAHFTKQQITELAKQLSSFGAKDSSFPIIGKEKIKPGTRIPVIENGKNVAVTKEALLESMAADMTTKIMIPPSATGFTGGTLLQFIGWVMRQIESGITPPGDITSSMIEHTSTVSQFPSNIYNTLNTVLDYIISILFGAIALPIAATTEDIESIFSNN